MMVTPTNKKRKHMTTNNPLDDILKSFKPVMDYAGKIAEFANEFGAADGPFTDGCDKAEPKEAEPVANYKAVFNLGLSDSLVLEDGSWQVVAIEEDAFDVDRVSIALDNGETYSLLRTSLVWVV